MPPAIYQCLMTVWIDTVWDSTGVHGGQLEQLEIPESEAGR